MFDKNENRTEDEGETITNEETTQKRSSHQSSETERKDTGQTRPQAAHGSGNAGMKGKSSFKTDEDKAAMGESFRSSADYKSQAIPVKDAGAGFVKGQTNMTSLNFEVDEDSETKKWTVHPSTYSTSEKWVVECNTRNEANALKKDLLDGRVKSPADAPHSYGVPRKGAHGNTMIYVKF